MNQFKHFIKLKKVKIILGVLIALIHIYFIVQYIGINYDVNYDNDKFTSKVSSFWYKSTELTLLPAFWVSKNADFLPISIPKVIRIIVALFIYILEFLFYIAFWYLFGCLAYKIFKLSKK